MYPTIAWEPCEFFTYSMLHRLVWHTRASHAVAGIIDGTQHFHLCGPGFRCAGMGPTIDNAITMAFVQWAIDPPPPALPFQN